ncbi:MAG: hypothetical protein QM621_01000 [Aeromicrobium sp.]
MENKPIFGAIPDFGGESWEDAFSEEAEQEVSALFAEESRPIV